MAESIEKAIRENIGLIISVITICAFIGAGQVALWVNITSLQERTSSISGSVDIMRTTVESFVSRGPRYTLTDHDNYAREQALRDFEQDKRLTIIEQELKGK